MDWVGGPNSRIDVAGLAEAGESTRDSNSGVSDPGYSEPECSCELKYYTVHGSAGAPRPTAVRMGARTNPVACDATNCRFRDARMRR
jgi:hypothetical protein